MEQSLVEFCYATLAGLKSGSLFSCRFASREEAMDAIRLWKDELSDRGVCLIPLRMREGSALIYVYRRQMLDRELRRPEVAAFLTAYDYDRQDTAFALRHLKRRCLACREFPHEIGVFLGYPLEDVKGFIANKGKNCKCTGCWKVYCDAAEAERTFARYKKCHDTYVRLWRQGKSVRQLTVSGAVE